MDKNSSSAGTLASLKAPQMLTGAQAAAIVAGDGSTRYSVLIGTNSCGVQTLVEQLIQWKSAI